MNLYRKAKLSPQEIRVCDLLLLGLTYEEISDLMFLAYNTVAEYKQRAFRKMDVRNVSELHRLRVRALLDYSTGSVVNMDEWTAGYRSALNEVLAA